MTRIAFAFGPALILALATLGACRAEVSPSTTAIADAPQRVVETRPPPSEGLPSTSDIMAPPPVATAIATTPPIAAEVDDAGALSPVETEVLGTWLITSMSETFAAPSEDGGDDQALFATTFDAMPNGGPIWSFEIMADRSFRIQLPTTTSGTMQVLVGTSWAFDGQTWTTGTPPGEVGAWTVTFDDEGARFEGVIEDVTSTRAVTRTGKITAKTTRAAP